MFIRSGLRNGGGASCHLFSVSRWFPKKISILFKGGFLQVVGSEIFILKRYKTKKGICHPKVRNGHESQGITNILTDTLPYHSQKEGEKCLLDTITHQHPTLRYQTDLETDENRTFYWPQQGRQPVCQTLVRRQSHGTLIGSSLIH